jgi:hypothetical protein
MRDAKHPFSVTAMFSHPHIHPYFKIALKFIKGK